MAQKASSKKGNMTTRKLLVDYDIKPTSYFSKKEVNLMHNEQHNLEDTRKIVQ